MQRAGASANHEKGAGMAGKAKVVLTDYVWESLEVEKQTLP